MLIANKNTRWIDKKYHFKRKMPVGIKIDIEKGDKVKRDTVLATGEIPVSKARIDLSSELKVKPIEVAKYLVCLNGERVSKGDKLALKKGKLISGDYKVVSPFSGVISLSEIRDGILSILDVAKETTINAGIDGEVKSVIRNKYVDIIAEVLMIRPFFIAGKSIQGELFLIEEENSNIEIGSNLRDGIVVLNFRPSDELIRKLAVAHVLGIIVGSIKSSSLDQINTYGLRGMTICVLEGFGNVSIDKSLIKVFKENDSYLSLLDTRNQDLILTNSRKTKEYVKNEKLVYNLKIGDRVQILDSKAWGEYGTVEGMEGNIVKVKAEKKDLINVHIGNLVLG